MVNNFSIDTQKKEKKKVSNKDKWLIIKSNGLYDRNEGPFSIQKIRKDKIVNFSLYKDSSIYIWVQTFIGRCCFKFDLPSNHDDERNLCLSKKEFDKLYNYLVKELKPGGELNKLDSRILGSPVGEFYGD